MTDLGDGLRAALDAEYDRADLLARERDAERDRAGRYLRLLHIEIRQHVALVKAVRDLRALLAHQKHDDAGYSLCCRDVVALLDQMTEESK